MSQAKVRLEVVVVDVVADVCVSGMRQTTLPQLPRARLRLRGVSMRTGMVGVRCRAWASTLKQEEVDVEATSQREGEVGAGQYSVASGREGVSQFSSQSPVRWSVSRPFSQSFSQRLGPGHGLTRCRCDVNAMPERMVGEDLLARNVNAVASGPSCGIGMS